MKRLGYFFLATTILCGFHFLPGAYGQEVIKLKWASPYPITHLSHKLGVKHVELIHKYTNNKVKITVFPQEQLGKAKDMLYVCSQGTSDFSQIHVTYFAGQLPLNNVAMLPFFTTATDGTEIYIKLIKTSPEIRQEFQKFGTRVLTVNATPQYDIGTVKKQVKKPEDAVGLKLKTAGGMYNIIAQQYKIHPVNIAAVETYESMQRGTVEGCVFSYPSIKAYRLNELLKYYTFGLRMGGYPGAVIVNEKKWNALPPDIQQGINKATEEVGKLWGVAWDREQQEMRKQFEKEGMVIFPIPAADRPMWDAPLKGIEELWIQDVEKKGLPARKVFNDFLKICKEVVK
ncbi:MAG: TRAP transporter substrate-binding protein DctP [Thermodesulfobacteriota bacterium]|jgi:TRAP-type C4-dicarboxylate transport system substrate-binding protein